MEKVKHSLIRIERMDGETACLNLTSSDGDQEELLAMLGDGLAAWLNENPRKWRYARKLMRHVLRDFSPFAPTLDYWRERWFGSLLGAGLITAAIYGLSYVAHWLGVV